MRYSDDFEEKNPGLPLLYMTVGVVLFIITVVGIVLLANNSKNRPNPQNQGYSPAVSGTAQSNAAAVDTREQTPYGAGGGRTSDDLNFWNAYREEGEEETKPVEEIPEEEAVENDPSNDGKHTKLVSEDGTEEWVEIDPYITRNNYNYSNMVYQYPLMKFYANGKCISKAGVTISSADGDVDFEKLKKAGIDFVMIRLGYRGYGSGNLASDERYYENVAKATEAGLDFGVIFYSQAVNEEEAIDEATRVLEGLQGFDPAYPVAFDMEYVANDTARVEGISRDRKSEVALAFANELKTYGYNTIIYGNKDWLIRKVNLNTLSGLDIWLSQLQDVPDYPYKYAMWEYARDASISGLSGPASLTICMIDYSQK